MSVSRAEENIGQYLRTALADIEIGGFVEERCLTRELGGLDFFLPQVLREKYNFWKSESLDGVCPIYVQKLAERQVEIVGICILITDQTVTPIHLRMEVSADADSIQWLECRLGEKQPNGGMARVKYTSAWPLNSLLAIKQDPDAIEWCFAITYGERTE